MKKAMAILLAAVLALACTACGGSKNGETKDRLAQIKEKGYIELCTEPYFAPYEYVDPNKSGEDQYQGMDIEVARYIADKIGVDLKITALDFTAVLAGVADGKYDFAISAIAYAPSRAEAMRLSDVYYSSNTGYGFIVRTEDIDKYNDLDSLKDAVVITQSGSVQEALYNQYINGACKEFKLVANMTDGYLAVAEGKADVCICSTASAQLYADANGGMSIPDYRFEVDPNMNGTCVAMPMEGTESLAELVNQCIAELKENGQTVYPTDLYKQGKWTWSVFQDYLTKIKAYFADKPAPIRPDKMINAFESDYRFSIRAAMLASGVPIYGENGFEKCTSPEAIKSVNFIKELVDKKLLVSELENSIYPGFTWADNNFANGEAVFLDSRQWTAQGCGSQLAALGLSMGLVPWPRPDDMAADDPRYQQVSTPNDSFILLKGVSEEQSRLALEAYKIYYQTYYAAKSGGSKSMDFFSDENAEKEALEKNLDIFHEKIGADILDIFKNYCPMEFNDYSMMLSQMYGFTEIAGRSIYEGGSSFEVSIAENIGALNEAIGKIEAAADAIS